MEHSANWPTSEQIAALRRISIGLAKIHDANKAINKLILEHDLEAQFGIVRLSSHPQGITLGSIAEASRIYEGAFVLEMEREAA